MPMSKEEDFGTNEDGGRNDDYCTYCFQSGTFTWEGTMDEMIEKLLPYATQIGIDEDEARKMAMENLPLLKRWAVK